MADDSRIWKVGPDENGEVDADLLAQELLGLLPMLLRLGGGVSIVARRAKDEFGIHYTERVDFGWKLHAPLPRRRRQELPPQVEDFEDEAEAAGAEPESVGGGGS